ncbi:WD40/YVTN/BNR-like repeat-containing protein [Poritiphilus flavus]|uniref:Oxidoreductase n=1 Tax=Poritiphilus flavus TaxID=2697053 RepID=A0A6L9EAA1_9FLAO|nr:oxidoreductase [Poritiphilus flavus]NAS11666.1 oxidoreductase [Poritiphilus flavus]
MRNFCILAICMLILSCSGKRQSHRYAELEIDIIWEDSVSIRAIEIMPGSLAFAADQGIFGSVDLQTHKVRTSVQRYDSILPHFRAVAHTDTDFFMLSIASPALLYKTGNEGRMELVYKEEDPKVFYDAMTFWDNKEGIAVGDAMNGCLSILITRDGGTQWEKLDCSKLPKALPEEGAFAASNSNIAVIGDKTWVATSKGRVLYSDDRGKSWEVFQTPVNGVEATHGIYSLSFWDNKLGVAFGGDYTKPDRNTANKAITLDGGKSWELLAEGLPPGYKSCVQFIPGGGGEDLVALGFTGIAYSTDQGKSWEELSDEPFYTLRFLNDSIAYAAGKNRIARLRFK